MLSKPRSLFISFSSRSVANLNTLDSPLYVQIAAIKKVLVIKKTPVINETEIFSGKNDSGSDEMILFCLSLLLSNMVICNSANTCKTPPAASKKTT